MGIANKKIKELINEAVYGTINIPEFQREFVWKPDDVKYLIESLYKGYPIGSILLWQYNLEVESKHLGKEKGRYWIIDGQQRITSLALLFGIKPYWWPDVGKWKKLMSKTNVMISIENEEISLANPRIENDPKWISFRDILSIDEKSKKSEFKKIAREISKKTGIDIYDVIEILEKIYNIRNLEIPAIYINHEPEDVAEIFVRLNRSGTKVKEADIVLALIASVNEGWVKNEFIKYRDDLEDAGWDFEPIILLRTLASISTGRAIITTKSSLTPEVSNIFLKKNVNKYWKQTKNIINEVIHKLKNYGISSIDLLPSKNSLIPMFVMYHKFKKAKDFNFNLVLYWLIAANYAGRYSGSALYAIQTDITTIKNSKTFKSAIGDLLNTLKEEENIDMPIKITADDIFYTTYQESFGKLIRLLMYIAMFKKGAKDWITKNKLGYEKGSSKLLDGFTPEWHHIYPKNILKKHSFDQELIDSVANITVLTSKANKKLKREPWEYIYEYEIRNKILRDHLIPSSYKGFTRSMSKKDLKKYWSVKNYTDFLEKRSKKIAKEINSLLNDLYYKKFK